MPARYGLRGAAAAAARRCTAEVAQVACLGSDGFAGRMQDVWSWNYVKVDIVPAAHILDMARCLFLSCNAATARHEHTAQTLDALHLCCLRVAALWHAGLSGAVPPLHVSLSPYSFTTHPYLCRNQLYPAIRPRKMTPTRPSTTGEAIPEVLLHPRPPQRRLCLRRDRSAAIGARAARSRSDTVPPLLD
eukprot:scaffold95461_cov65-Phaeocystis_antarctica.AAC.2